MRKGFKPTPHKPLPKIYVVPTKAGEGPRDPSSRAKLPDAGAWVPDDNFWNRRLRFKEVKRATPPKPQTAPKVERTRAPKPKTAPKITSSEE